jgi:hypothetical protein
VNHIIPVHISTMCSVGLYWHLLWTGFFHMLLMSDSKDEGMLFIFFLAGIISTHIYHNKKYNTNNVFVRIISQHILNSCDYNKRTTVIVAVKQNLWPHGYKTNSYDYK